MSFDLGRLPIAIGKNGDTKKKIEQLTGTKITIDSTSGDYHIEVDPEASSKDGQNELDASGVRVYTTNHILEAINFGFNPDKALKLLDSENILEVIDLESILGHSEKRLKRIKGRIIGDHGKIRNSIEQFSGVFLSIYKKHLALIGEFDSIKIAKKGINMIIQGSAHKTVLAYLQYEHQKKKQEDFTKIWKPTL
ncbi:hypothetical protein NEF87_002657 [Candidatus Lokiarchaeum ossiferum]|uniref:K Homology domain-containing protein n=1 Tax=Candidatus Lokiarchaeum ossiferum TaxID=2951803 RepID=A0ABY6HVI6_9ARCH|nr:hypothetical protein NEF87_002657 [Candidatus Lokiarchaeum sp. B-35]